MSRRAEIVDLTGDDEEIDEQPGTIDLTRDDTPPQFRGARMPSSMGRNLLRRRRHSPSRAQTFSAARSNLSDKSADDTTFKSSSTEAYYSSLTSTRGHHPRNERGSPRQAMAATRNFRRSSEKSVADIETILDDVFQKASYDHSMYAKNILKDTFSRQDVKDFTDVVSPFVNMKAVALSAPNERTIEVTQSKKKQILPVNSIQSVEKRVPKFKYFLPVDRSFLVENSSTVSYLPNLINELPEEDERESYLDKLRTAYDPMMRDAAISLRMEQASKYAPYVEEILERAGITKAEIIEAAKLESQGSQNPVTKLISACESMDLPIIFLLERDNKGVQSPALSTSSNLLGTYQDLGCHICGVHVCLIHGEYAESDASSADDKLAASYNSLNMSEATYVAQRHERLAREIKDGPATVRKSRLFNADEYCSAECFMDPDNEDVMSYENWTPEDIRLLQALLAPISFDSRAACVIAPSLGKTCAETNRRIHLTFSRPATPKTQIQKEEKKLSWYDRKSKTMRIDLDWGRMTRTHLHHERGPPRGCSHRGLSCSEASATKSCSCIENNVTCEKICSCPDDCFLRFMGCSCKHGCRDSCACRLINRECDPDLCLCKNSCENMSIQNGLGKMCVIGEGAFGIGLFAAEDIKNGDYIIEYIGEIISNEEAERRGIVYDYKKLSYRFQLNSEYEIDAERYGNNSRYINHSSKSSNCLPTVLLVNLEHRILLRATRDISSGDEIFFDYGSDFVEKYGLLEQSKSTKGRDNGRGVGHERGGKVQSRKRAEKPIFDDDDDEADEVEMAEVVLPPPDLSDDEWDGEYQLGILQGERRSSRRGTKVKKYTR